MTEDFIDIQGITMCTTRYASKQIGWTHDYISRLARESKIKGAKIGRQWYVDLSSVKSYAEFIEHEKKIRAEQLKVACLHDQVSRADKDPLHYIFAKFEKFFTYTVQGISLFLLLFLFGYAFYAVAHSSGYDLDSVVMNSFLPETLVATVSNTQEIQAGDSSTTQNSSYVDVFTETLKEQTQSTTTSSADNSVIPSNPPVLVGTHDYEDALAYIQSLFSDPVNVEIAPDGVYATVTPLFNNVEGDPVSIMILPNPEPSPPRGIE